MKCSPKNEHFVIIYSPTYHLKPVFFFLNNTKEDILRNTGNRTVLYPIELNGIFVHKMEINGIISSFVFHRRKKLYRFGTTCGGETDGRIFIFGWTIPLNILQLQHFQL